MEQRTAKRTATTADGRTFEIVTYFSKRRQPGTETRGNPSGEIAWVRDSMETSDGHPASQTARGSVTIRLPEGDVDAKCAPATEPD